MSNSGICYCYRMHLPVIRLSASDGAGSGSSEISPLPRPSVRCCTCLRNLRRQAALYSSLGLPPSPQLTSSTVKGITVEETGTRSVYKNEDRREIEAQQRQEQCVGNITRFVFLVRIALIQHGRRRCSYEIERKEKRQSCYHQKGNSIVPFWHHAADVAHV